MAKKQERQPKEKPTHEQIANLVLEVIVDRLGVQKEKILRETKFGDDLGADSMDMVDIAVGLDEALERYGLKHCQGTDFLPNEALDVTRTYGELVSYVCGYVAGSSLPELPSARSSKKAKIK